MIQELLSLKVRLAHTEREEVVHELRLPRCALACCGCLPNSCCSAAAPLSLSSLVAPQATILPTHGFTSHFVLHPLPFRRRSSKMVDWMPSRRRSSSDIKPPQAPRRRSSQSAVDVTANLPRRPSISQPVMQPADTPVLDDSLPKMMRIHTNLVNPNQVRRKDPGPRWWRCTLCPQATGTHTALSCRPNRWSSPSASTTATKHRRL